MKTSKKSIVTGAMIAGAVMGTFSLSAAESNLLNFNELGSGSVVRAHLLDQKLLGVNVFTLELKCGEGTNKGVTPTKTESKSKEAKCGEGKCGESKTEKGKESKTVAPAKADTTSKESKSKEAKCGEGKCGVE